MTDLTDEEIKSHPWLVRTIEAERERAHRIALLAAQMMRDDLELYSREGVGFPIGIEVAPIVARAEAEEP